VSQAKLHASSAPANPATSVADGGNWVTVENAPHQTVATHGGGAADERKNKQEI